MEDNYEQRVKFYETVEDVVTLLDSPRYEALRKKLLRYIVTDVTDYDDDVSTMIRKLENH